MLLEAATTAEAGDLSAAVRRLALVASQFPEFETREELAALLPSVEPVPAEAPTSPAPRSSATSSALPAAAAVPTPRTSLEPSTVDFGPLVRLRLGPGVPDAALLHPRPVDTLTARQPRRLARILGWLGLAATLVGTASASAWWFLLR